MPDESPVQGDRSSAGRAGRVRDEDAGSPRAGSTRATEDEGSRRPARSGDTAVRPEPGSSPFRTWNGRDSWEFVDGVRIHAIGGEQVLLCRVQYAPGKQVPWHAHPDTEQVMVILDGGIEMTIEEETKTLGPGDVVVVNRGQQHKVYSAEGVTFMEALAPVPLDHVPDQGLDLVLGPDGGARHVAK